MSSVPHEVSDGRKLVRNSCTSHEGIFGNVLLMMISSVRTDWIHSVRKQHQLTKYLVVILDQKVNRFCLNTGTLKLNTRPEVTNYRFSFRLSSRLQEVRL